MSSLTSTSLQCTCKTSMQNWAGPGVNGSQVRGARCLVSKSIDLFDTALQVQSIIKLHERWLDRDRCRQIF
jgi:hypothetical protein